MDNLTHGLLGVAVGMLRKRDGGPEHGRPLSGTDKAVFLGTLVAAELPDIDVFFGSGIASYEHHRGWTHSVFTAPFVALIAMGLTKLIWRDAKAGTVYLWSLASVLFAHLFNDFLTGWGTRILTPLNEVRYGLDWIPIVDLFITVPLIVMALKAYKQPEVRRAWAAGVIAWFMIYSVGYRGTAHTLVTNKLRAAYASQEIIGYRVSPDMLNPLRWSWVVDTGAQFEQGHAYPWGSVSDPTTVTPRLAADDPVVMAVRNDPELAPFFAQFGFVDITYEPVEEGYRVSMGDVRYRFRGAGMDTVVILSEDLKILRVE